MMFSHEGIAELHAAQNSKVTSSNVMKAKAFGIGVWQLIALVFANGPLIVNEALTLAKDAQEFIQLIKDLVAKQGPVTAPEPAE